MAQWRNATLMRKAKKSLQYVCQECGSTEDIQAHHNNGKDNNSLVVLCGKCHALKHLELSPKLFLNKKELHEWQLWLDKTMFVNDVFQKPKTWFDFGKITVNKDGTFWEDGQQNNESERYEVKIKPPRVIAKCNRCGSLRSSKAGRRHCFLKGRRYLVQWFLCNDCGHQFTTKSSKANKVLAPYIEEEESEGLCV